MIDLDGLWVVTYSVKQNCLNIETMGQYIQYNIYSLARQDKTDYVAIFIGESLDVASDWAASAGEDVIKLTKQNIKKPNLKLISSKTEKKFLFE